MIYKFIVRLVGAGISALITFQPIKPIYENNNLIVRASLSQPVTKEIHQLVQNGFVFGIRYSFIVIVNDQKTYKGTRINRLSYEEGWRFNGKSIDKQEVQDRMGVASMVFKDIQLDENDNLLLFIKATICSDDDFKSNTGLHTRVLWNHYIPRIKKTYTFQQGSFNEH